ncbi:glycosyltransferase family 4 protein [bacterium]|nr:glycosyltransferase family 4 protein [bacterium]
MRILIDARYLDGTFSGIATYSRLLVEHLARVDEENEYQVVVRPGFRESMTLGENFELLSYRARPVSTASYFRYQDLLSDMQPDVVHALYPIAPVFYNGALIVTIHDVQPLIDPHFSSRRPRYIQWAYNMFYRWAYPNTLSKAKWIICDSYSTRDDVARLFPGAVSKLIVIHPGLDKSKQEPPSEGQIEAIRGKFHLKERYLLYYGSTRPNKNIPAMLKAFARLKRQEDGQFADLQFALILKRDRFFRDIERTVRQKGIKDDVIVLDQVEQSEQRALLAGSQALAFATKFEGFGFPILEAMAAGVPVLAGRSGSLPEVAGEAALLVDPDDLDDIADGMARLLTDQGLRADLVSAGHERITGFDWMDTAERIRDIYNLLI